MKKPTNNKNKNKNKLRASDMPFIPLLGRPVDVDLRKRYSKEERLQKIKEFQDHLGLSEEAAIKEFDSDFNERFKELEIQYSTVDTIIDAVDFILMQLSEHPFRCLIISCIIAYIAIQFIF